MGLFADIKGSTENAIRVGANFLLKGISGGFAVRNVGDTADAKIQASTLETSNDSILINYDAASSGNDWTFTFARNPAQTAALTVQAPPAKGTDGHFLRQKAGTAGGVLELELAAGGATSGAMIVDTTSLAFGTASPLTLFSTPANAVIHRIEVVIDTPFNGTPTVTVGIAGTTAKYMGAAQNNLNGLAGDVYQSNPGLPATAGESLIATYSAGGASAGAARILVHYSVPT